MTAPGTARNVCRFSARVDHAVGAAVDAGQIPGAVVLAGVGRNVVLHRAYGSRSRVPTIEPMRKDTVFDLASLTKPLATGMAAMLLMADKLTPEIDAPLSQSMPSCHGSDKAEITLRQLMSHTSGLQPYLDVEQVTLACVLYGVPTMNGEWNPARIGSYSLMAAVSMAPNYCCQ